MNRNFGKLNGEGQMEYAPDALRVGGMAVFNPREEHYRAAGYLRVTSAAPSEPAPEGRHYEPRGWEISGDPRQIRRVWELVDDPPPPPRVFSCLYLEAALLKRGLLPAFDALLATQTIEDPPGSGHTMPLRRAYDRTNDISSAHPLFGQYFAAAKTALSVDDKTAEAILAEAETGGV